MMNAQKNQLSLGRGMYQQKTLTQIWRVASNQRDGEQTTETLRETADEELFVDICYLADDVKNTNR